MPPSTATALQRAQAKEKLPQIIADYAAGKISQKQAEKLAGVSRYILYKWMFQDLGPERYRQLITDCLINRIADADESLESADDALAIARARERMKFSRMDFERRRPHLYGQKQEVTHQIAPILNISVAAPPQIAVQHEPKGVVIEGERVQVPDNK